MNEEALTKESSVLQAGVVSILLVVATATSLRVGLPSILQVNKPQVQAANTNSLTHTSTLMVLENLPTK